MALACLGLALVSPAASAVLAVLGLAAVWLRGYLVPFTPRVAPRLVAALPFDPTHAVDPYGLRNAQVKREVGGGPDGRGDSEDRDGEVDRRSDEDPEPATLADATTADGEAILGDLLDAGVLRETAGDVDLAPGFEERWWTAIRDLRERPPEGLASAALSVAPAATHARGFTDRDRTYVVLTDDPDAPSFEAWLRRPVALAETAAARALREAETGLDPDRQAIAAHALVVFLDECPDCGTALAERPAGGCCGPPRTDSDGRPLSALVCESCRAEFAAFEQVA